MKKLKQIGTYILLTALVIVSLVTVKTVVLHYTCLDGIAVLGYHDIVSDTDKKTIYKHNPYKMSVSEFEKQMRYLAEHQYKTLRMDELYNYLQDTNKPLPKKAVVITFDDGFENVLTYAYPILQRYHFHATSFVIGKKVETNAKGYLQQAQLTDDQVMQYASHSYDLHHKASGFDRKKIDTLSLEQVREDFTANTPYVKQDYFAFPYGRSIHGMEELLANEDVKLAFGYNQNRKVTRNDNMYLLPRFLVAAQMPFVYFTWIVS
ncbi:hypothetical protein A4S06_01895 [Erysipelotrichaceae bacterium MTC7]|nr:hypothetical protein A4S06_01895 [Erysipelotrichaceae bacterium MTC7]